MTSTRNTALRIFLLQLLLGLSLAAEAQNFDAILQSIEQNSTALGASRMEQDAAKAESRLENTLDDPEAGFNYLFGSGDIGRRWDLSVSQTFDFPTVYAQRARLAKEQRRVADMRYLSERQQLLLQARKLCIEVVYCNAMMDHLDEDLEETRAMAAAYETLYQRGEATEVEHNKAHQAVLLFEAEYRSFQTLHGNLLAELQCLNGGQAVSIPDTAFLPTPLSADFDLWLAQNLSRHPELQLAESERRSEEQALKVARSSRMPRISVGYMGEFERDDHYQGLTLGLSLPVWSSAKKVKVAKTHAAAAAMREKDAQTHLTTQLRSVYNDALQLQQTCEEFARHLTGCDNTALLRRSLAAGQITLLEYLQELQSVHEMHEKFLEAQRDLELRKAELQF